MSKKLLSLLATSILFASCGGGGGDGSSYPYDGGPEINKSIASTATLTQPAAFDERPDPTDVVETNTYSIDGRTYECREQRYEVAAEFNELVTLNPTTDVLWPGAIIDAATVATGDYVPIVAARKPITISVSLVNIAGAKSRTVQDPKLSTMREAIADILAQEVTGATEARVTFEIANVYSASQLDLALGVSYKSGLTSVRNQFDFSRTDVLSRTLVKFMQVYYTIDVDVPQQASDLFAPSVTWDSIKAQMSGNVSPVYVSSIAYGRMAFFSIESTYSSTEVSNALNASIKAIKANVDLDTSYKNVLATSTMKATIIGGSGQSAVQVVNGFDGLKEYMTQGGNYNKDTAAAPLAYKMRYLRDNSTCEIVMAQNYEVKTCTELKMGHYGVENSGAYVAWFYVIYDLDGQEVRWMSNDITWGRKASVDVPAKATNVWVRIRYSTGVSSEDILRYPAVGGTARPEVKCWNVSGEIYSTHHDEVTCDF
jgi:thiol-activated cytolysin